MMKNKLSDSAGSAFVELALVLPILMFLIISSAEFGRIAYAAIEVSNAARAGVAYGAQTNLTNISSNIQQAAQSEAPNISSLSTTASTSCVCETVTTSTGAVQRTAISICSGTASTIAADCPESTTSSTVHYVVNYVTVHTSATVTTMFHYPGIPSSFTLNGFAEMRQEQD